MMNWRGFYIFWFSILGYFYPHFLYAEGGGDKCQKVFSDEVFNDEVFSKENQNIHPSRLYYEKKATQLAQGHKKFHSEFTDVIKDHELQNSWREEPDTPTLLKVFLPPHTHFIGHQLFLPGSMTAVKMSQPGHALMIRAYYQYKAQRLGTNVAFNIKALESNMNNSDGNKWLVRNDAQAAILFLHGGGSKSAGAHVAEHMISHFSSYNIDVVAPDLPWHAEGHREFLGSFVDEIKALGVFAKKYIPSHIPLFVWGHSLGSLFAEQIMRMSDQSEKLFFFHNNLKGVMIFSTAVDAAPGKPVIDKVNAYTDRHRKAFLKTDQFAESEANLWSSIVEDGKTSLLGSFFGMWTIVQNDQTLPDHKGDKYIPALMAVGQFDPIVYIGFEDLFHNFYDKLTNVETHYLTKLPYFTNPNGPPQRVGHLLGDYLDKSTRDPVHYVLAQNFIKKHLHLHTLKKVKESRPTSPLIVLTQLFANDLAFREFLDDFHFFKEKKTGNFVQLYQKTMQETMDQIRKILYPYRNWSSRVYYLLNELSSAHSKSKVIQYKKELDNLINYYDTTLSKDHHFKLIQFLNKLRDEMEFFLSNQYFAGVNFLSTEIKNEFNRYFASQSKNIYSSFIQQILVAEDYDSGLSILYKENLPSYVLKQALPFIEKYFTVKQIMDGHYIPTRKQLRKRAWIQSKSFEKQTQKNKIHLILEDISKNVNGRIFFQTRISDLLRQKERLSKEYNQLFIKSQKQIKLIKVALVDALSNPPFQLRDSYNQSYKKFQALEQTSNNLTQMMEELTIPVLINKEGLSIKSADQLIRTYQSDVDQLNQQYRDYIDNRRQIREQLISVISRNGWKDYKYQQAVWDIYGKPNEEVTDKSSTHNLFFKLTDTLNQLAETEAKLYHLKEQYTEQLKNYQIYMDDLGRLVGSAEGDIDWIFQATNTHQFDRVVVKDVLNPKFLSKKNIFDQNRNVYAPFGWENNYFNQDRDSIQEYISKKNESIKQILTIWHQMHSKSLPLVPVVVPTEIKHRD